MRLDRSLDAVDEVLARDVEVNVLELVALAADGDAARVAGRYDADVVAAVDHVRLAGDVVHADRVALRARATKVNGRLPDAAAFVVLDRKVRPLRGAGIAFIGIARRTVFIGKRNDGNQRKEQPMRSLHAHTMAELMELTNISDTARWVAMYRAMETERRDAIFRDAYARRLAGARGEEILASMPKGKRFAWPMIVRTSLFDEIILRVVEREGADTILNLAAGLHARPYRLPPPSSLPWIDVDLPPMIDYKRELLAKETPRCRMEYVSLDLADRAARQALFARVGAGAKKVLVATEGLLVYLTREQAGELADDVHAQPSFRFWLIDIVQPFI